MAELKNSPDGSYDVIIMDISARRGSDSARPVVLAADGLSTR